MSRREAVDTAAHGNAASKQIEENKLIIANLESEYMERKAKLKHLEYDVNVIEKEGRKLARELDKVLRIQIDNPETTVDVTIDTESSDQGAINDSVDSCHTELFNNNTTADRSLMADEDLEAACLAKRSLITGSPAGSGASSSGNSSDKSRQTITPELPDLTEAFLVASEPFMPTSIMKKLSLSSGGRATPKPAIQMSRSMDQEAENSDTGLSSLHSSSDEAQIDFGTLV